MNIEKKSLFKMTISYYFDTEFYENIEVDITVKIIAKSLFEKVVLKDKIAKKYIYSTIYEVWNCGYLDYLDENEVFINFVIGLAENGEFLRNDFYEK